MADSIVHQLTGHRARAHQLAVHVTDIASWSNNAQHLGRMLVDCADDFAGSDAAALDFQNRVLAIMEAVGRNLELISETAMTAEGEARHLAAALPENGPVAA
jgi:hypothetical protein